MIATCVALEYIIYVHNIAKLAQSLEVVASIIKMCLLDIIRLRLLNIEYCDFKMYSWLVGCTVFKANFLLVILSTVSGSVGYFVS